MIDKIPDLINAGIDSFKVEGRMKTNLYVAVTARTYREAIDDYLESPELYESKIPHYIEEISNCTMRDFTRGFYYGKPSEEDQIYDNNTYIRNAVYMGLIEEVTPDGVVTLTQKNKFSVGDTLQLMLFDSNTSENYNPEYKVITIWDEYDREMESAPHPKQKLRVKLEGDTSLIKSGMLLRTRE